MDSHDESTAIQTFYTTFQAEFSTLDSLISSLSDLSATQRTSAIDQYLSRINQLSDKVKDAANYLPAYDTRKYSEHLRTLSDKLSYARKAIAPRQKFAFKAKHSASSSSKPDSRNIRTTNTNSSTIATPATSQSPAPQQAPLTEHISISEKSHIYLPIPQLSQSCTILLSSIDHTLVSLQPQPNTPSWQPPSIAAMKNISRSLLFFPQIDGPAHLTSINDCILILSCRQFRMHDSHNTQIYLLCPSRPIIEDCTDIGFAPLPEEWIPESLRSMDFVKRKNLWDSVDDFKWLRPERSPHWKVLEEEKRVSMETWKKAVESFEGGSSGGNLQEVLNMVLPVKVEKNTEV